MTVIVKENVEVGEEETEIIGSTETPSCDQNRVFAVASGNKPLEVTAWGSENGEDWEEKDSKTIRANDADSLIVGPTIYYVKLTGKVPASNLNGTTTVDAALVY